MRGDLLDGFSGELTGDDGRRSRQVRHDEPGDESEDGDHGDESGEDATSATSDRGCPRRGGRGAGDDRGLVLAVTIIVIVAVGISADDRCVRDVMIRGLVPVVGTVTLGRCVRVRFILRLVIGRCLAVGIVV